MGLKPFMYLLHPFTKVNGNVRTDIQLCFNFIAVSFS